MSIFSKKPKNPRNEFSLEIPDNTAVTLIADGKHFVIERSGEKLKVVTDRLVHYL